MQNKVLLKLKSDSFMNFTNKDILYLKREYLDKNNYHLIIKNFETDKKKIKKKLLNFLNYLAHLYLKTN